MPLPPAPINEPPTSFAWQQWYLELQKFVGGTSGTIPWDNVNKAGSDLADLATKDHASLQNIQGGTTGERYHLTATEHTALTNSVQGTWTPTFTSLTEVLGGGTITKTGRYSRVGRTVFWQVLISTTGGATTASTAGTTYHDLPVAAAHHDTSTAANFSTLVGIGTGVLDSTNDRNYPPTWGATSNTIVLSGKYEV